MPEETGFLFLTTKLAQSSAVSRRVGKREPTSPHTILTGVPRNTPLIKQGRTIPLRAVSTEGMQGP